MKLNELTPELIISSGNLVVGSPRNTRISTDGTRIAFLRADTPTGLQGLWINELTEGEWTARRLDAAGRSTAAHRAKSAETLLDRQREIAEGVLNFTASDALTMIAYTDGEGASWLINTTTTTSDPHPLGIGLDALTLSPSGEYIAFVTDDGDLIAEKTVGEPDGRRLASVRPTSQDEFIGRPDFIAAEELDRFDGLWWAPDSTRLLYQYVDERDVALWTIADPADPAKVARRVRYPVAGGEIPLVGLRLLEIGRDTPMELAWDRDRFPYLMRVVWSNARLSFDVQSRDQRTLATYVRRPDGTLEQASTLTDDYWIEPTNGTVAHRPDGELCQLRDERGKRTLWLGTEAPNPALPGHILLVTGQNATGLLVEVAVSHVDRRIALVRWDGTWEWLTAERGVGFACIGGGTVVTRQEDIEQAAPSTVIANITDPHIPTGTLQSFSERCEWSERVEFVDLADGGSTAAIIWPTWYRPETEEPLPVIVDSYGGPLINQVLRSRSRLLFGRWYAEQGYAVISIDSIGAPGRGPAWERLLHKNLAGTADAHLAALDEILARFPNTLDRTRIGVRGWSFGGYLAALIAIRRPDLCRAAVVGAPLSDWALYDAHYSERYLGTSTDFKAASKPQSVMHALDEIQSDALPAPMLILHGFSDDNVVVANSIQLSEALSVKAIPHGCILLSSLRHVARGDVFAKLRRIELEFLAKNLA